MRAVWSAAKTSTYYGGKQQAERSAERRQNVELISTQILALSCVVLLHDTDSTRALVVLLLRYVELLVLKIARRITV